MPDTDVRPADPRARYHGAVVAVGGPPHSGKSVFLAEAYRHLAGGRVPFFLERACPDGEGIWSAQSDPAVVRDIRRKGTFSPEFIAAKVSSIERLGLARDIALVLVDLGGKLAEDNARYLARCTHLVILSASEPTATEWTAFAAAAGCPTIATFRSRLVHRADGTLDDTARSTMVLEPPPVTGDLLNLDRDQGTQPYAAAVGQFMDWLIGQVIRPPSVAPATGTIDGRLGSSEPGRSGD